MSAIAGSDDSVADSGESGEQRDTSGPGGQTEVGRSDTTSVGDTPETEAAAAESGSGPAQATADSAVSARRPDHSGDEGDPTERGGLSGSRVERIGNDRPGASPSKRSEIKPGDINSVLMLLEYAYSLKGNQVKLPQTVFKQVAADLHETQADPRSNLVRLMELSADDPLLAVPPRLLAAIETSNESVVLRKRLIDLLLVALAQHRVFKSDKVRTVLAGEASSIDDALRSVSLATSDATAEELGMPSGQVKPTERERLRDNAIISLTLLLYARDAWSVADLVERLELYLWREAAKKSTARPATVAVTESPNLDSLEVVAKVYRSQVDRANKAESSAIERIEAAERHVQMATARSAESDNQRERVEAALAESRAENAKLRESLAALRSEIDAERRGRVIDESHHVDDYESLRTRVSRVLDRQIDLLSDGLHALKNGSTAVTEEYIERSIESFNKELQELRDEEDD